MANTTCIRTWPQFVAYVGEGAAAVPAYSRPEAYPDHRVHAAFTLFFQLSIGERFGIYEDALGYGLTDRYGEPITGDAIFEYCDNERDADEADAFINLAAWGIPAQLDAALV